MDMGTHKQFTDLVDTLYQRASLHLRQNNGDYQRGRADSYQVAGDEILAILSTTTEIAPDPDEPKPAPTVAELADDRDAALRVMCAWCGRTKTGTDATNEAWVVSTMPPVSHGICPECAEKSSSIEEATLSGQYRKGKRPWESLSCKNCTAFTYCPDVDESACAAYVVEEPGC